jgi:chemotaxis protein MotB
MPAVMKKRVDTEDNPYALSIADLMSGLLLIIVLVLFSVIYRLEQFREKELARLQKIDKRVEAKKKIIEQLTRRLSKFGIVVKETGAIQIGEKILFDFGESDLKPEGKLYLKTVVPIYANVLLSQPSWVEHISQIIIEGHTDNVGPPNHEYQYNLDLSLRRAQSVALFIFSDEMGDFEYKSEFRKYLTVNGRSFEEPMDTNETEEGRAKNRRVEFKFRMKDYDVDYYNYSPDH